MPKKKRKDANLIKVDNPDDQKTEKAARGRPGTIVAYDSPDDPPEPGEERKT